MSHDAVNPNARWALFLDVDGTLIELAETPESVYVPPELKSLLHEVTARLEGALALVSGRTIANIDELFDPLRPCASGVHGAERRGPDGRLIRAPLDTSALRAVREELAAFARVHEGVLLEDKGFALAVHFRLAPQLADAVHEKTATIVARLGASYVLQAGKCVYEIRPSATTKGTAVRTFMQTPPFAGRQPIYIGDDVTDEDAFEAVNELGGISVRVGDTSRTSATHRLPTVTDVHRWIRELPAKPPLLRAG
ncbi:MAG: trehalose-phosphatase [Xanthomonadaceae bacterium]|nr:trehalose-phosphatase [Xanthomonadaceae bacterium]